MSEYVVEGYGAAARNPNYDGPYLDGYDFDPNVNFMFAGDPEKQAELQKVIDDTEGVPVLENGTVKIITPEGEDNVVILGKEPENARTVVLSKSAVDEISEETAEAELESSVNPEGTGAPSGTVDTEQDSSAKDKVDLNGPSGADEQREGKDYNPTATHSPRTDDSGSDSEPTAVDKSDERRNEDSNAGGIKLS